MAVGFTTYFAFPLLDDGAGNAGAALNGTLIEIDRVLHGASDPQCHENEVLVYEGQVLHHI